MSNVLICGGGVIGLCAATMLGRGGHRVTVLEADPAGQPMASVEGWATWERPGVAQFRQPHNLSSRFRMISDQELPGLVDCGLALLYAAAYTGALLYGTWLIFRRKSLST